MSIWGNPVMMGGSGGGGGGSTNVLSGITEPTAAQGDNGQIYLQYAATPTLPTGYTLLESIVLTGTQYIDTGIPANTADLTVDLVYRPTSGYTQEAIAFGADWSTTGYFLLLYSNKWRFHSKGGVVDDGTADVVNYSHIRTTPSLLTVNGTDYAVSGSSANSGNNLMLGYSSYQGGRYGRGTLKSMSMWSGSTPLRDFWPVLDENNVPCLYDAVSGTTYYNAGSGTFGYNSGGVENEITQDYAKVNGAWQNLIGTNINDINLGGGGGGDDPFALTEYIESSGTQYINTGYLANDNTKIEIVVNANAQNAAYASLFGARNAVYDTATKAFVLYRDNTAMTAFVGAKPGKASVLTSLYFGQKTVYVLAKNNLSVKGADGINHYGVGFTGGTVDNEDAIYLLSFNQAGSDAGSDVHCSAKLYRFRIWEDGVLVHEFLPWQENGVACLKDTLTGNIKYNAGTGSFVYGVDA